MTEHLVNTENTNRTFIIYKHISHKTYKIQFLEYASGIVSLQYASGIVSLLFSPL